MASKTKSNAVVLNADVAEQVLANARPAEAPCLCGCGNTTKGRFFPGHDATLKRDLTATVKDGKGSAKANAQKALVAFGW